MKKKTGPDSSREIKENALDLLEWALADMSPDAAHPLHFKCGFEREGHFVPPMLMQPAADLNVWSKDRKIFMLDAAMELAQPVQDHRLKEVYYETPSTFLLELVTEALGLKDAAQATSSISEQLNQNSKALGWNPIHFGSIPLENISPFINQ